MSIETDGRSRMRRLLAPILATLLLTAGAARAQTTNAWVPASGNADWNTAANWNPASVPDGAAAVAIFTNTDYAVGLTSSLSADVTVNGIVFNDYGASDAQLLRIQGRQITFAGTAPFLSNSNDFGGQIHLASTARVSGATLILGGRQGCNNQIQGPLVGNGTLLARDGNWELMGLNSNFTGRIVVSNFTANGYLDGRGSGFNSYGHFGDTGEATHIYGNGFVRVLRDGGSTSNAEPFHLYGVNANGSIRFYANTNCTYRGAVTLHTNGTINISQWFPNAEAPVGARKDFFFNGSVGDDGNGRNLHFLLDTGGATAGTGTQSRTSRMVLGGQASHGGFTHASNTKNTDGAVEYTGWLELTNGTDRLPAGTTLYLGGRTNVGGITIGAEGANGVLILAGADQALAGLQVLGTGTQSRVIGGVPTNNTLTLNTPAGPTDTYRGFLGGGGVNENNLALVKAGAGTLALSGSGHGMAGDVTVNGGVLALTAGLGFPASGGMGVFSSPNALTANAGGTLQYAGMWSSGDGRQHLVRVSGGTLDLVNLNYVNRVEMTGGAITRSSGPVDAWRVGYFGDGALTVLPSAAGSLVSAPMYLVKNGAIATQVVFDVADGAAARDLDVTGVIRDLATHPGLNVIKMGAGTMDVSGANPYTGLTVVNDGTLRVNNAAGSGTGTGAVTVNIGGTLGGTGIIAGAVTVAAGAKFAAGNSVGTNTVGSLTLTAGSTFEVEADGAAVDQTIVAPGSVDLGGATLTTVALSAPTFTSAIIISNAAGLITGTFAGLYEADQVLVGGVPYFIHYRPTYVELNQTPTAVVLHQFGAIAEGAGVVVRWRTASEVRTAGFDLYRRAGDAWVKVTDAPIAAAGAPQGGIGASYAVSDAGAAAGGTYEYKLVEIEQDGTRREYGPFERTATAFEMTSPIRATAEGMEIRWLSRAGERYRVLRASELRKPSFEAIAVGLDATPPENVFLDTHAAPLRVYRVELEGQ